ncbi:hypothetical protein D3C87_2117830 [compost metagenome]
MPRNDAPKATDISTDATHVTMMAAIEVEVERRHDNTREGSQIIYNANNGIRL